MCVGVVAACAHGQSAQAGSSNADIARIVDVKAAFGPQFQVTSIGPMGIDPRLLGQPTMPPGMTFDPVECASVASQSPLPSGVKGNMAATTAEGDGNRFIAIALETSEPVAVNDPADNCHKVSFSGGGVRGLVEVVQAPAIDGVHTLGTHRVLQTIVDGKPRIGELYNYVAGFDAFRVIVTANPLVLPDKPVAAVDTQRARDLLNKAVTAVKD